MIFNALLILLHRPFLSEGHLSSVGTSSRDEFSICESAAVDIDIILQWYKTQWCIKNAPYFLSYAAYASATIHVRAAAQNPRGEAHRRLQDCLEILSEHQKVCHAPRRALANLLLVIQRLKVNIDSVSVLASRTSECHTSRVEGIRDETLIRCSNENKTLSSPRERPTSLMGATGIASLAVEDPCRPEIDAPVPHLESLGNFDLEVGEVPDWMSFFDLDPIFGFNNFSDQI